MEDHEAVRAKAPERWARWRDRRGDRRWIALALLCLAEFMLVLDVTAANVALPSIGADLGLGSTALTWVLTAYVLTFGGLMLLGGRLADLLGRRRVLVAGLVLFTAGSMACGLAGTGLVLIGGRVLQGVGAALMSPAALSTITTTFTGAERNRALGVWAAVGGSGFAAGLLISGLLTAGPGWEWVFLVNVPVGLALLVAFPLVVPADGSRSPRVRPDLGGAVLGTTSVALLVYGLTDAGETGVVEARPLLLLTAALATAVGFVALERRVANPLVRVDLLARRPAVSGTLAMLTASALMLSLFFVASLYLQQALGYGALHTGIAFLPAAVAITVSAHVAGPLVMRLGGRAVAVGAFGLAALGAVLATQAQYGVWLTVVPGLAIAALGLGPAFVVATSTALAEADHHHAGSVSGIVNTAHEIGGAIGVALVSTVAIGSFSGAVSEDSGFVSAFLLAAGLAGAAALAAAALLPPDRPTTIPVGHGHGH